ncbi:hypothetical protein I552_3962 [Mycobacterium xenopi 3993]|nr:hypothetical protein I552_3962 [Mycobacterium xenopi 3993]
MAALRFWEEALNDFCEIGNGRSSCVAVVILDFGACTPCVCVEHAGVCGHRDRPHRRPAKACCDDYSKDDTSAASS